MILDSATFFYDLSFDDYDEAQYLLRFGTVFNGYTIVYEHTKLTENMIPVTTDTLDTESTITLNLLNTIAIIKNPKIDIVGISGKLEFINNVYGKIAKFVNEIHKLELTPYGYGVPETINGVNIFTDFTLLGFITNVG